MNRNNDSLTGLMRLLSNETREFLAYAATIVMTGSMIKLVFDATQQVEGTALRAVIVLGCMPCALVCTTIVWYGSRTLLFLWDPPDENDRDVSSPP